MKNVVSPVFLTMKLSSAFTLPILSGKNAGRKVSLLLLELLIALQLGS